MSSIKIAMHVSRIWKEVLRLGFITGSAFRQFFGMGVVDFYPRRLEQRVRHACQTFGIEAHFIHPIK
ncbi:MAG: hypothetical protein J0L73_12585 [Verrucomicrobia bacterium]|nr:hypothetical protein [Verrucomicrobiota bacterium]